MRWSVKLKENSVDKFYQTYLYLNDSEYAVGERYFYSGESEKDKAWQNCLESAVTLEKKIMSVFAIKGF